MPGLMTISPKNQSNLHMELMLPYKLNLQNQLKNGNFLHQTLLFLTQMMVCRH